ncbi:MAG: hypothetical protein AB7O37_04100 [Vicinamibacteria bacterium]
MSGLFHGRWRRRVSLLALDALSGAEHADALRHLDGCAECRAELQAARAVLELLPAAEFRSAEPPLSASVVAARVLDRLAAPRRSPRPSRGWRLAALPAAAAALLAVAVVVPSVVRELRAPAQPPPAGPEAAANGVGGASLDAASLRRLERTLVREQAARYLSDAQALLVTVAATPPRCDREGRKLDVSEEASRSRELLQRRALLLDIEGDDVAAARPVLEDVDELLRAVAELQACARPGDVLAIQQRVGRGRLLMKMDLVARELMG